MGRFEGFKPHLVREALRVAGGTELDLFSRAADGSVVVELQNGKTRTGEKITAVYQFDSPNQADLFGHWLALRSRHPVEWKALTADRYNGRFDLKGRGDQE